MNILEDILHWIWDALIHVFKEFFFEFFAFYVGWIIIKTATLGRYPNDASAYDSDGGDGGIIVSCLGFFIITIITVFILKKASIF